MPDERAIVARIGSGETLRAETRPRNESRLVPRLLVSSILCIFTFLALGTITRTSPTIDEPIHLLGGYSYLKWADYRVNPEHPPFAKILAGLPLLVLDVKDPRASAPEWDQIPKDRPGVATAKVALQMFYLHNDAETLFFYGKLPFVFLALVLGLFVFLWAEQWFGWVAGGAALILFFTNPTILAHSTVVHTDIAFTTFFFVGSYFFQRALRSQSWLAAGGAIALFGLAAITKFSAIGIFITWSLIGLVWICYREQLPGDDKGSSLTRWQKASFVSLILVGMVVAGFGLTWASYGFRYDAIPGGNLHWSYRDVVAPNASPILKELVILMTRYHLMPDAWIYGQFYNISFIHRNAFLLGSGSVEGFWLYFPIAVLTKTPLAALVLIGIAIFDLASGLKRIKFETYVLWISVAVYFSLAVYARMNIGLRHVLPIFPFLFLLAGASASRLWVSGARWTKGVLVVLAIWAFWNLFASYPNYFSFFNEAAGGWRNGPKILADSNVDWGQDLKSLKTWLDDKGVKKTLLLYFGLAEPAYYGIDAVVFPGGFFPPRLALPATPELPYTLALSVNHFYFGGFLTPPERALLQSLHLKKPDAIAGQSILIFNLDPNDPQVNLTLGTILLLNGQWELAEQALRKVSSDSPFAAGAQKYLAQARARQGNMAPPVLRTKKR